MDAQYAAGYERLYREHWWWRARESELLAMINRLRMGRRDLRILDVGCGNGLFFDRLRQFGSVQGVESDARLVDGNGFYREGIYVGPFDDHFKPARFFDLILMLDVVEHVEDERAFLRRAAELLSPHGRLLITVPAFPSLWTRHDDINHHFRRYTKATLKTVAEEAGLVVMESRYTFSWLAGAKFIVRHAERLLRLKPKPAEVPRYAVNTLLFHLSKCDLLLSRFVSMPFGSSLFAILQSAD